MRVIILLICCFWFVSAQSQTFSDKKVGAKNQAYVDSIKMTKYEYLLPIWGEKAHKLGFELPNSAGIGINYFTQKSDLLINNLFVGFNQGPMYNLDEVVRFTNTTSKSQAYNIRPDIWLFPFLNVYAIFAKSTSSTDVDFGIWLPVDNTWREVIDMKTQANFDAVSTGFGMTPTIGIGGGWLALDMNYTWTDIDALEKPAKIFVFGPRMGKMFQLKKPDSNINFWVGGFRIKMNTGTSGSLPFSDLISTDGLEQKIDNGYNVIEESQTNLNNWWGSLTPAQQKNPVNKTKYDAGVRVQEIAGQFLNGLSGAVDNVNTSSVQYALDKKQKDMWNFLVGAQYQINKNWMFRSEYGFMGSRQQFLAGLQYRFGL